MTVMWANSGSFEKPEKIQGSTEIERMTSAIAHLW
jgi:hypothetical protein